MGSLLTIAIPTWNRNEQTNRTLEMLIRQLRHEISILVIDNHSSTPIEKTISAECKRHVKIHRNALNIGAAANILRCIEMAETEWVWIFGDDDDPTSDAIARVLDQINKYPNCCWLDFGHPIGRSRSTSVVAQSADEAIDAMYYPNGKSELFGWSDGHISNEILNRRILRNRICIGYKYLYTWYPHVAMLFSALSDGDKCRFTGPPLAFPRVHKEAPNSYTHRDLAEGWKQLAGIIADPIARKRFSKAILNSTEYGEASIQSKLKSLSNKTYRTVVPRPIRQVVSELRSRHRYKP